MEGSMSSEQQSTQESESPAQPAGQANSGQGQPSGASEPFEQTLQRRIAETLQPVLGTFQQRIVDSVRQQVQSGVQPGGHGQASDQAAPTEGQTPAPSGLQQALHQSVATVKRAMDWLIRTVHRVVDTVGRWLDEVAARLRRIAVAAIIKVVKAIAQPLLKIAIDRAAGALEQQGKQKLAAVGR